ncbi:hypothetical protein C8N32_102243 [Rhodovulum imhoffii]|uniref:Uncharacterized protein n=1 Tax=Rhodovulum imhoffii TaxID=365340 RepID=A0A2T5BVW2_9RHOB|nr:hypothetical protein [Rhodovulum imhoffii]MBK5933185.1 hypothetical protein [Rhodovulum imhoffii]PTN03714.1 hypothetical protein C8N32_102243 [Rhodovulum imhoffii]
MPRPDLTIMYLVLATGCAPMTDFAQPRSATEGTYPTLAPIDTLLEDAQSARLTPDAPAELEARAAALRARAARLRATD